jgi:DNA invertase Pin-like site-specific DNA recombinase
LAALGVGEDRVYVDHGLTGANCDRPGLRQALAACRAGDTLVVTKLDRLARSLPGARDIPEDLTERDVKLSIGASVHDPTDPVGRLLFNLLAMVVEFEADLIRLRTKEGMASPAPRVVCAARSPSSTRAQRRTSRCCTAPAEHTVCELEDLFGISRPTVYRAVQRDTRRQPATRACAR